MNIILNSLEQKIFEVVGRAGEALDYPVFAIGGFVRDKLIGRRSMDMDFVCQGDGILLAKKVRELLDPKMKLIVFKTYGTAQLKYGGLELEFVGARKESYSEESRNPKVSVGTLEDDQNRRDFTINALAIDLSTSNFGQIIDPFNGLADLEAKIIKTPLDPDITFSDDPLRMMRAVRFASQLNFTIDANCFESVKVNKDRIKIISQERISDELNKIMMSKKPSIGLDLLYKAGILEILLPELTALVGTEYIDNIGHKDNFYHSLQVLDNIVPNTDNLWLRWSALLHDIGKAISKRYDPKQGWTFHGHEIVSGKLIPKIFKRLKLPTQQHMQYVRKIVELHHRPISLTKDDITDAAMRRLLFDAGDDLEDLMTLCKADITSKNASRVKRYRANFEAVEKRVKEVEENDKIRNWEPPISGELIMETFQLKPSREVGKIKMAIREAILDGDVDNNYESAYEFMMSLGKEMGLETNINEA